MSDENQAPVTKILRALRFGLRHFIFRRYTAKFGKGTDLDEMERVLFRKLNDKKTALATLDIQAWLKLMNKNWETVFREKLDYTARGHVNELRDVRNQDSHENDLNGFTHEETYRIATTAIKLLEAIDNSEPSGDTNAEKQIQVIQQIEQELLDLIAEEKQNTTEQPEPANDTSQSPTDNLNGQRNRTGTAVATAPVAEKEKAGSPSKTAPASNKEAVEESTPPQPQKPRTRPSKRTSHANVVIQRPIRQNQGVIRFAIKPNVVIVFLILAIVFILFSTWFIDVLIDMAKDIECNPETLGRRYGGLEHAKATIGCLFH